MASTSGDAAALEATASVDDDNEEGTSTTVVDGSPPSFLVGTTAVAFKLATATPDAALELASTLKVIDEDIRLVDHDKALKSDRLSQLISVATNTPLPNHRVVVADAERTRAEIPIFKLRATRTLMANVVTYYCQQQRVKYRQGMNEVLAPFVALKSPPPPAATLYTLLTAMIETFLHRVIGNEDDEFVSLQTSLKLFRHLLLYHDPELCNFLDQYHMTPELYVTGWFVTLFARGVPMPLLFRLWDRILQRCDATQVHFVALALLMSHRDTLIATPASEVPSAVSAVAFQSIEHVEAVCRQADKLASTTPKSFRRHLNDVCYSSTPPSEALVARVEAQLCMSVDADELVADHSGATSASTASDTSGNAAATAAAQGIRYMVLDCRPQDEFDAGHLPTAFHLNPELLADPEQLHTLMEGFKAMKGCHFCIMGSGSSTTEYATEPPRAGDASASGTGTAAGGGAGGGAGAGSSSEGVDSARERATGSASIRRQRSTQARQRADGGTSPTAPSGTASAAGAGGGGDADADADAGSGSGLSIGRALSGLLWGSGAGDSGQDEDSQDKLPVVVALLFLQNGFQYTSVVHGGYSALHQHFASTLDTVLVSHQSDACQVCIAKKPQHSYGWLLQSLSRTVVDTFSGSGADDGSASPALETEDNSTATKPTTRARTGSTGAWLLKGLRSAASGGGGSGSSGSSSNSRSADGVGDASAAPRKSRAGRLIKYLRRRSTTGGADDQWKVLECSLLEDQCDTLAARVEGKRQRRLLQQRFVAQQKRLEAEAKRNPRQEEEEAEAEAEAEEDKQQSSTRTRAMSAGTAASPRARARAWLSRVKLKRGGPSKKKEDAKEVGQRSPGIRSEAPPLPPKRTVRRRAATEGASVLGAPSVGAGGGAGAGAGASGASGTDAGAVSAGGAAPTPRPALRRSVVVPLSRLGLAVIKPAQDGDGVAEVGVDASAAAMKDDGMTPTVFPAAWRVARTGATAARVLVVSSRHFMVLDTTSSDEGTATIEVRREIEHLVKVTMPKSVPRAVSLHFRNRQSGGSGAAKAGITTVVVCLRNDSEARALVRAVKQQVDAAKTAKDPPPT